MDNNEMQQSSDLPASFAHATPDSCVPPPTSFSSHRPSALITTTLQSTPNLPPVSSSSPHPSSSPHSASSASSSPLVLSPSDLSSVITLKQNYDTLLQQHNTLHITLQQHTTQLTRLTNQHAADEADWERRTADSREQYQRVMRDWSEESEKRQRTEESERAWKQQYQEAVSEQRHTERASRLLEADLENERRLNQLLRDKITQLEQRITQLTPPPAAAAAADNGEDDPALLHVHRAVLTRRVQRLELELSVTQEQLTQQRTINTQQQKTLTDINSHLTALTTPAATAAASAVSGEESGGVVMAEVECVVLKERLKCEQREHWKRERKLYCLVLLWLVALLIVSFGGLLCL